MVDDSPQSLPPPQEGTPTAFATDPSPLSGGAAVENPSSSSSSSSSSSPPPPPLPESFLAMAKDSRYVAMATQLVLQIMEAWQRPSNTSAGGQQQPCVDAWYVSAILYAAASLLRSSDGRTLGMEITELEYGNSINKDKKNHVMIRSMAGITTLYVLHRWVSGQQRDNSETQSFAHLRGSERMQAFRNRRRAMMQRSTVVAQQSETQNGGDNDGDDTTRLPQVYSSSYSSRMVDLVHRMQQMVQRWLENFMTFQTGGPHDLTAQQLSAAWWCLRLYAAYYCLSDGRFPSLGHYLLNNSVKISQSPPKEKGDNSQSSSLHQRLVNRPQTHRLVALLILSHTAGVVVQNASKWLLRWWFKKYPPNSTVIHANRFKSLIRPTKDNAVQSSSEPLTSGTCAICQQPRKNPACPTQCGHVFCWDCLQKWIVSFRAECPVCRTPSRPQDVLPLYNYAQTFE